MNSTFLTSMILVLVASFGKGNPWRAIFQGRKRALAHLIWIHGLLEIDFRLSINLRANPVVPRIYLVCFMVFLRYDLHMPWPTHASRCRALRHNYPFYCDLTHNFEYDLATGEDPLGHANKKANDILVILYPHNILSSLLLGWWLASHHILFGGLLEGRLDHFERERAPI